MITCFIAILPESVLDAPPTNRRALSTRRLFRPLLHHRNEIAVFERCHQIAVAGKVKSV